MSIINFLQTKHGNILFSIILAFGLASILRIACVNANLLIIKGPPIENVQHKIFSFDNKCYSYKTVNTSCNNLKDNKL
jgi:hypothetical protein